MIVYDFDNTIYKGDSGVDLIKYSFKKKPFLVIISLLKSFFVFIKYIFGMCTFEEFKSTVFSFLYKIKDLDIYIEDFVEAHIYKIKTWYKNTPKDIVISASYDLWIEKFCKYLNIRNVIATTYNRNTGKIDGTNCRGEEKVNRYKKCYKVIPKESYGDSPTDKSIIEYATCGFVVKGNKIIKYTKDYKFKKSKLSFFINKDFVLFVFCGGIGTLTNFMCSLIISTYINPILSYVCGYTFSLFVSYYCNIKLIFKRKINIKDFIKFIISYIPNFVILFSFVYVFIDILKINKILIYASAALLGIPITFIFVKIFAFKDRNVKDIVVKL